MSVMTGTEQMPPMATTSEWHPWRVAGTSGFQVRDPDGNLGLVQIDRKRFLVTRVFRYADTAVLSSITDRLVRRGMSSAEATAAVEDACTFTPHDENPTDLASVPRFMRWFESSYGTHTLAAIIHDNLIVDQPNGGALADDTLSDRFFREMMRTAGVPWLKRWIMWAAVALRTRWAVGGLRRASVVPWLALSASGITAFVWAVGAMTLGWSAPVATGAMLAVSLLLPFAASALWGRQYAAGLIAAVAALWILPAAVLAGVGYLVYVTLERVARLVGLR